MQLFPAVVNNLPAVIQASAFEEKQKEQEYANLKDQHQQLQEEYNREDLALNEFMAELNKEHMDLVAEIQAIDAAIESIQGEAEEDTVESESFAEAKAKERENSEACEVSEEELREANELLLKEERNRLFKEIALKTHPDRTKNKGLVDFFVQAQKAYKAADLEKLVEIHAKVFKKPYKKIPVEHRLSDIKRKISDLVRAYNELLSMEEYGLLKIARTYGFFEASIRYRSVLIDILKQKKRDKAYAESI